MVRAVLLLVACLGVLSVLPSSEAQAACRMTHVIGQWERDNQAARLYFFSNKKAACRLCNPKFDDRCRFIYDPKDPQNRKQCSFKHPGGTDTTLTGWSARDGMLDKLAFSDGTTISVAKGCEIDGKAGTMKIDGLGTFVCDYEYHCRKLERD